MRQSTMFLCSLGVEQAVLEDLRFETQPDGQQALVVRIRPIRKQRSRCAHCGKRCPGSDRGDGLRRWRGVDLGLICTFIECFAPHVCCPTHGVGIQGVPWARLG